MRKILFSIMILFSFISFSNITNVSDANSISDEYAISSFNKNMDKFIIKSKTVFGEYLDAKLIDLSLVDIKNIIYVKASYDVSIRYNYVNAKIIRSKKIDLLHPIFTNEGEFALPSVKEYLDVTNISDDNNPIKYKEIKKITVDKGLDNELLQSFNKIVNKALEKLNNTINKEKIEPSEILKYFPYIQFDNEGYAYIKGTNEKLTSEQNPLIIYDPIDNVSIVEYVDFIDGRFIPNISKIKNDKDLKLEDLATKNGSEFIKHIEKEIKLNVNYFNERVIAEIIFENGKMKECKILP